MGKAIITILSIPYMSVDLTRLKPIELSSVHDNMAAGVVALQVLFSQPS